MKAIVYPVGPNPKSDKKIKASVLVLGALLLSTMGYDLVSGHSVTEEGHVMRPLPKQRALIVIDHGPNQGENVRASYASMDNAFTISRVPQEGDQVKVSSHVGGLSGVRYTSKFKAPR